MKSDEYLMGMRIGRAIYMFETLERLMKKKFKNDYKLYKYKLRRLSDLEADELFMELALERDINAIKKYIG